LELPIDNKFMTTSIKVILFDLGGVLVELGAQPIPSAWLDEDDFTAKDWFTSETAVLFEKGLITPEVFAETLKNDLNIKQSNDKIIEHFTAWPIGLYAGANELLLQLKTDYKLAVLSNTNTLHWPRIIHEFKITDYIEFVYASHLLNMAKPESAIFRKVVEELNTKPANILFFDDNEKNIQVSRALGIQGFLVKGIEETKQCLIELGLINQ